MKASLYLLISVLIAGGLRAQPGIVSATVNGTASPNGISVNPGASTTISAVVQDTGAGVQYVFLTFEVWPSPSYTCKVGVQLLAPLNQSLIYLHDDAGNVESGMTVGSGSSESNQKCTLYAAGSSVTQSGGQYTVTANVVFNSPYNGVKYVYVDSYDNNGVSSGWYCPNASLVVGGADYAPQSISVSPASGSSSVGAIQQFQVTIRDPNGAFTMWHLEFMLAPEGGGWLPGYDFQPTQRCKVVAETSANLIWVEGDSENAQVPPGFANFGASNPSAISSSRCTLYPSMSTAVFTDIDTLVVTFAVSFSPNLTGPLQDHMYIADNLGLDHWDSQSDGIWNWNVQSPSMGPLSQMVRPTSRDHVAMTGCSGGGSENPYLYNYDPPTIYTLSLCSGNIDLRHFDYCVVGESGVTAQIQNLQQNSFDILLTPSPSASLGQTTLTCVSYYYWGYFQFPLNIMDDAPATVLSNGSLSGAVQDSVDNGDGSYTLQLSPLAYDYLADNGFLPAAAAGGLVFIPGAGEVVIAVGGAIVITTGIVSLYHWWQIHKNDAPPSLPRPKNAPTGTVPIDKYPGLTSDQIHEIKDSLGLGAADWTGIAPNGDVITGDMNGNAEDHGPWQSLVN